MECVARRTRRSTECVARRTRSRGGGSGEDGRSFRTGRRRARARSCGPSPPPPPPGAHIVLDDSGDEAEGSMERHAGGQLGAGVATRTRSRRRSGSNSSKESSFEREVSGSLAFSVSSGGGDDQEADVGGDGAEDTPAVMLSSDSEGEEGEPGFARKRFGSQARSVPIDEVEDEVVGVRGREEDDSKEKHADGHKCRRCAAMRDSFRRRAIILSSDSESEGHVETDSVSVREEFGSPDGSLPLGEEEDEDIEIIGSRGGGGEGDSSSVARRKTRLQLGIQTRVSYTQYFKEKVPNVLKDVRVDEEAEPETGDEADNSETTASGSGEASVKEGESSGFSLKKRKFSGIEILIPVSGKGKTGVEGLVDSGGIGVGQRTRSHFHSEPSKKKKKLGTISNPHQIDVDGSEYDSDYLCSTDGEDKGGETGNAADGMGANGREHEEGEMGNAANGMGANGTEDKEGETGNTANGLDVDGGEEEIGKEELGNGKSNKRKRVQVLRADSLLKLLVDTILTEPKNLPEGLFPSRDKSPMRDGGGSSCPEDLFPLVFTLGDEDSVPEKKTEQEMALDELWADCNFAMELNNMGTYHIPEGHTEPNKPEVEADPPSLCSKGEHRLIFNEQIGYMCKFCSTVVEEIKDILPSWATHFRGQSARKSLFHEEIPSIFDDVFTAMETNGGQQSSSILEGTVWNLIPPLDKPLYQHQRDAFEFMWENLAGGVQLDLLKTRAKSESVGGCVISHAPGTGKTRLAIMFIQTYLKVFPGCRPVIIAPRGMLLTWEKEFKAWDVNLPFHILTVDEYSGNEDAAICELVQKEPKNSKWPRIAKMYTWSSGDGILGVSYGLFQRMTDERSESADISKILLEKPGLLVLDEGHTPRNKRSLIWKALEKVQTKQRIFLSGTPFQNNILELYNMLRLVRPKFAEKISSKTSKLCQIGAESLPDNLCKILPQRNEEKVRFTKLTNCTSEDSLEELRLLIKPFVHVYNGKILEENLPGLRDCLILLEPLPQQKWILDKLDDIGSSSTFKYEHKISLAAIHPSLLISIPMSEKEKALIDEHLLEKLRLNPDAGVKTRFVMEIVRFSEALKEKVVVFSQYLDPLSMIKDHLIKQFNWTEGKEVLEMHGKIPLKDRQFSIDVFNDKSSKAKVILASTRACCEGISLTGASRVILLDIVWNPAVERQAISRAYRIGQTKVVHVYHLITSGTGEGDKYQRQAKKSQLSRLIFSPENNLETVKDQSSQTEEEYSSKLLSEDKILGAMTKYDKFKDMFTEIYYQSKESSIASTFG